MTRPLPENCVHFTDLFDQLGLASSPQAIADFIGAHSPLRGDVLLAEAPFWNESQAQFLREKKARDEPPYNMLIDQLNASLRE